MNKLYYNQLKINKKFSMVDDISTLLISFLDQYNLKLYWTSEDKLYLEGILGDFGFLSLFLFDKQDFINCEINKINLKYNTNYKCSIKFIYKEEDTFLGYYPIIEHNLCRNKINNEKTSHYQILLSAILTHILSSKNLFLDTDNGLHIDNLYDDFVRALNQGKVILKDFPK